MASAFPTVTAPTSTGVPGFVQSLLQSASNTAGLPVNTLDPVSALQLIVANLLTDCPPAQNLVSTGRVQGASLNIGNAGGVASDQYVAKQVTALPDNTATSVLTITIPNAAHAALIELSVLASLGAGGAVGAFESNSVQKYNIVVSRTAGISAVTTVSAAFASANSVVAGTTATALVTVATVAPVGAGTVAQTVAVNCLIHAATGSATNHVATIEAKILNAAATGITIS